ncbi:MAG: hypothetical protein ABI317_05820 [Gaiellales bacterium]
MSSGKKNKNARRAAGAQPLPASRQPAGPSRGPWWRQRLWLLLGGGAVVVAAVIVVAVVASGGSSKPTKVAFDQMANLQTSAPPWNNDIGDLATHLSDVDLTGMSSEALAFHIHSHLNLYVNGKKVAVPAGVGIGQTFITEVHTHTPDGVIHVESPVDKNYVLGQFFGEWGVKLTRSCVGRYCGKLRWWVDGTRGGGVLDPADIILRPHEEIAIAYGTPPKKIPASYKFPAGE